MAHQDTEDTHLMWRPSFIKVEALVERQKQKDCVHNLFCVDHHSLVNIASKIAFVIPRLLVFSIVFFVDTAASSSSAGVSSDFQGCLRIVHVSDTHNLQFRMHSLPRGDILLHTGDLVDMGLPEEFAAANAFFRKAKKDIGFKLVVVVSGNHDWRAIGRWNNSEDGVFPQDRSEIFASDIDGKTYNWEGVAERYYCKDSRAGSFSDDTICRTGDDNSEGARAYIDWNARMRAAASGSSVERRKFLQEQLPEAKVLEDENLSVNVLEMFRQELNTAGVRHVIAPVHALTTEEKRFCQSSIAVRAGADDEIPPLRIFGFGWDPWSRAADPDAIQTWGESDEMLKSAVVAAGYEIPTDTTPSKGDMLRWWLRKKYANLSEACDILMVHAATHGTLNFRRGRDPAKRPDPSLADLTPVVCDASDTRAGADPVSYTFEDGNANAPTVCVEALRQAERNGFEPDSDPEHVLETQDNWSRLGVFGSSLYLRNRLWELKRGGKMPKVILSGHVHSSGSVEDEKTRITATDIQGGGKEGRATITSKRMLDMQSAPIFVSNAVKNDPPLKNKSGGFAHSDSVGAPRVILARLVGTDVDSKALQWDFKVLLVTSRVGAKVSEELTSGRGVTSTMLIFFAVVFVAGGAALIRVGYFLGRKITKIRKRQRDKENGC